MKIGWIGLGISAWMLLALSTAPLRSHAQLRDSSRTAIQIGVLRNTVDPFTLGSASVERNILPRTSIVSSLGINPFSQKGYIFPVWRFYWQVSMEARYYFALRRGLHLSGFYAGVSAAFTHKGFYYDHSWDKFGRERYFAIGPLVGYQHVFPHRLLLGAGFSTVFYPKATEEWFDPQGNLTGRSIWPAGYTFNTFLRIGITFK